jgi:serpin B
MLANAEDAVTLVQGNNRFAVDLYARLRGRAGNLFFSPYSLSTALAMTYAGARGRTAEQMAAVLHFGLDPPQLHPAFAALIGQLQGDGLPPGCELAIANALWGQKDYGFVPAFMQLVRQSYGAGLMEVDFARAHEAARQTINACVEQQTRQKIKELLKPGILDPLTRLVLTNAIYFKGSWALPFAAERTRDEPFTTGAGRRVRVPLMQRRGEFRYMERDAFQVLELPYAGGRLCMDVFLPRQADGLAALEKALAADELARWTDRMRPQEVAVCLPRFTVTAEFLLNDVLSAMGMPLAFDARDADFSGLDGGKEPGLFISAVVHKAYVGVNEDGTEAAAATAVVMTVRGAAPAQVPVFRADHPFLCVIRDTRTGSILFMGRLTEPQG